MINAGIEAQRTRRAVQDVLNAFTELVVDTKSLVGSPWKMTAAALRLK